MAAVTSQEPRKAWTVPAEVAERVGDVGVDGGGRRHHRALFGDRGRCAGSADGARPSVTVALATAGIFVVGEDLAARGRRAAAEALRMENGLGWSQGCPRLGGRWRRPTPCCEVAVLNDADDSSAEELARVWAWVGETASAGR